MHLSDLDDIYSMNRLAPARLSKTGVGDGSMRWGSGGIVLIASAADIG